MKHKTIYLISGTGAVKTNSESGAAAFETYGYRRCTREEYQAQQRRIAREDAEAFAEEAKIGGYAPCR